MLTIEGLRTAHVGPIDLAIGSGECVTVVGASGAGKSLMLRAVVDLDPNRGDVRLDGESRDAMAADAWRRRVALVPAESGWWADRVGEHFADPEAARPLLAALGLADALDWEVGRLSSGERHRLAIVRALHLDPRVLLLDEPTAALDEAATGRVEGVLRERLASGTSILLVTHDPRQAGRLGDRTLVMRDGTLAPADEGMADERAPDRRAPDGRASDEGAPDGDATGEGAPSRVAPGGGASA